MEVGLIPECWTEEAGPQKGEKQASASERGGHFAQSSTGLIANAEQMPWSTSSEVKLESEVDGPLPACLTELKNTGVEEGTESDAPPCVNVSGRLTPECGEPESGDSMQKQTVLDIDTGTVDAPVKPNKSEFDGPQNFDYETSAASAATDCGTSSQQQKSQMQMTTESDATESDISAPRSLPDGETEQAISDEVQRLEIRKPDTAVQGVSSQDVHKAKSPDTCESDRPASDDTTEDKTNQSKSNASVSDNVKASIDDFKDLVPQGDVYVKPDTKKTDVPVSAKDAAKDTSSEGDVSGKQDTEQSKIKIDNDETAFLSDRLDAAGGDESVKDMIAVKSAGDHWGGAKPRAKKTDLPQVESLDIASTSGSRGVVSHGSLCEELGQRRAFGRINGRDEDRPMESNADIMEEEDILPRKFGGLLKLTGRKSEAPQAMLHSLEVIK